ncbi:MAG: gluconate 2-dehydrogenase subunit 3 family protein [Opitutaceae bacterium]|nr:gluconate 2-dehydrogenase subunit 3 family protein [Opitutaceae bacterium]
MNALSDPVDPGLLSRREALRRAALLLGAALTPSLFTGALGAQPAAAGAAGRGLTPSQLELVTALADRILPRTDTPGASDVGVPAFINLMVAGYLSEAERAVFLAGVADLNATSRRLHQADYARLSPAQQDALLRQLATASAGSKGTFLHLVREATIVGYFTSETVGKTVTHYDPVPGRFDACVPISEVGNVAWTR